MAMTACPARIVASALALIAGSILATTSPAGATQAPVTASMMTINSGVYYDDCVETPYNLDALNSWSQQEALDWGNVNGYYNYSLKLRLINADGTVDDGKEVERSDDLLSPATDYDDGYFFICNQPGTYRVQASGWWCPIYETPEDSPADCETISFSKTFTMRKARSTIALTAPKKAKANKAVPFTALAKVERSTGYYGDDAIDVALQYKKGARWAALNTAYTSSSGVAHLKAKFSKPGKYQVRAVVRTISSDNYSSSASRVVAVKIKR